MRTENVETWLDAGTPEALHETNHYLLAHGHDNTDELPSLEDTQIIPPVFIHPAAIVSHSIIGPNASIDEGTVIQGSTVKDSIIATGAKVTNSKLKNSLLGHDVSVTGLSGKFNLGDDSSASC